MSRDEKKGRNSRSEVKRRVTEGVYNILSSSVYVSVRQEMNDDSLYIRAVGSTQHVGASVSLDGGGREWIFMYSENLYQMNEIKTPFYRMFEC